MDGQKLCEPKAHSEPISESNFADSKSQATCLKVGREGVIQAKSAFTTEQALTAS
jgi:hypothetical protein